jgi:uncharacterized protein
VIDFHVHQPRSRVDGTAPYAAADYAAYMDELGVAGAVLLTYDGLLRPTPAANDSLASYAASVPGRFTPFATVDPRDSGAAAEIERCVRVHGMHGVKLHPWLQGFSAHEPGLDAVCEAAAALAIPVLFHDGTPPFSTPLQLASLARRHPRTTIVLGHGGLHDLWREAAAAVQEQPNIWICLCATPPYAMRAILGRVPPDRVLFGTDGGLAPHPRQRYVALRIRQLDGLRLDAARRRAMLEENPARLLGEAP